MQYLYTESWNHLLVFAISKPKTILMQFTSSKFVYLADHKPRSTLVLAN